MKERPILFSAPMVRAILDGSKTQTRRVAPIDQFTIKELNEESISWSAKFSKAIGKHRTTATFSGGQFSALQASSIIGNEFCPYGRTDDRLWVRECWRVRGGKEYEYLQDIGSVMYRATHEEDGAPLSWESYKWNPSIFMPRWASRITLEITAVRVERLQDISAADAVEEGMSESVRAQLGFSWEHSGEAFGLFESVDTYRLLWNKLNGPTAWDKNPWVWVIEFKRIAQP